MKEKIYLDANIIYGYFLAKYKELKGTKRFEEPKVIRFLRKNRNKLEYHISIITKAEILRRLVSELGMEKETGRKLWTSLLDELAITEIKVGKSVDEIYGKIVAIVEETKIKKRVTNLEHLIVAKSSNLIFVTGDEEILKKCKKYYQKIMSYIDLRRVV